MTSAYTLVGFRVTSFRSVEDSGWLDSDRITALIGTNESGKSNLLLALWKLKPASDDGEIDPVADYPRRRYTELKGTPPADLPAFIEAEFALSADVLTKVVRATGADPEAVSHARVTRRLNGTYGVSFPRDVGPAIDADALKAQIAEAREAVTSTHATKGADTDFKKRVTTCLEAVAGEDVNIDLLNRAVGELDAFNSNAPPNSRVQPIIAGLHDALSRSLAAVTRPGAASSDDAKKAVIEGLPSFVYYSNYGNLDSEIYLPHVIQNLQRKDIQGKEAAKTRTLKILFDFVKLSPQEILELGKETSATADKPTEQEIEQHAAKKKEREILLQSASTALTTRFREWWKQGDYRLRFQADGSHFRIWVSDDRRPEEVELEGRSTGLQWFLSFYLTFLVESRAAHAGAILLLDEPGLSLHPLSQRDLSLFFENLAATNQLIYTTHSPFMVDADHLDRVRAVYVDPKGFTVASPDLRAGAGEAASKSIFAVHAALNLSVSTALLTGCQPIIVEGTSDQIMLGLVKLLLLRDGIIAPGRDLVFLPAGGVRGVRAVVAIICGKEDALPHVVLDSDKPGRELAKHLRDGKDAMYAADEDKNRIVMLSELVQLESAEVEDLFAPKLLASVAERQLRGPDESFTEVLDDTKPFCPQVEAYATRHSLTLADGWKVELARALKARVLRTATALADVERGAGTFRQLFVDHLAVATRV